MRRLLGADTLAPTPALRTQVSVLQLCGYGSRHGRRCSVPPVPHAYSKGAAGVRHVRSLPCHGRSFAILPPETDRALGAGDPCRYPVVSPRAEPTSTSPSRIVSSLRLFPAPVICSNPARAPRMYLIQIYEEPSYPR